MSLSDGKQEKVKIMATEGKMFERTGKERERTGRTVGKKQILYKSKK